MADDEFTQDLFRFLQLLCEGHNNGEKEGWVEWRGGEVWGQSGRVARVNLQSPPPLPVMTSLPICVPLSIIYFQPESNSIHPPS